MLRPPTVHRCATDDHCRFVEASTLRLEPEPEFEVGCCAHVQQGRGERCCGPPARGRLL